MKIVKRDGRLVEFDQSKIKNAVLKSFVAVDGELTDYAITKAENIAAHIESLQKEERLTVEQIQDLVEHGLMSTRRKDVAKAYITYRHERTKEREKRGSTFTSFKMRRIVFFELGCKGNPTNIKPNHKRFFFAFCGFMLYFK